MATAKYWPFFYRNIKIILKAAEKRTERTKKPKPKLFGNQASSL